MPVTVYADHQEAAARHLVELLHTLPHAEHLRSQPLAILEYRDLLAGALDERCTYFRSTLTDSRSQPTAAPGHEPNAHAGRRAILPLLVDVASRLERFPTSARRSMTTVLDAAYPSTDTTTMAVVTSYGRAAVELLAGTHCLSTDPDRVWTREAAAAWPLLGDLARSLEACLTLDQRLMTYGVPFRQATAETVRTDRRTLRDIAVVADQHAYSWRTEVASPRPLTAVHTSAVVRADITRVSSPAGLVHALEDLGARIAPINGHDAAAHLLPPLTARDAALVAKLQVGRIMPLLQRYAPLASDYDFDSHREAATHLSEALSLTARWRDDPLGDRHIQLQVSEIGVQTGALARSRSFDSLTSPALALALLNANRGLTVALAARVEQDLHWGDRTLAPLDADGAIDTRGQARLANAARRARESAQPQATHRYTRADVDTPSTHHRAVLAAVLSGIEPPHRPDDEPPAAGVGAPVRR